MLWKISAVLNMVGGVMMVSPEGFPDWWIPTAYTILVLGCGAMIIALVEDIVEWYQRRDILFVKAVDQAHEDRKLKRRSKTIKEFTETPWFRRIKRLGGESFFWAAHVREKSELSKR